MSSFAAQTATPQTTTPDPNKHVNFSVGMVLGVDDLTQEFAYHQGRDQWLARDLLGYGTVCGLKVSVDADAKGPRVLVTSGAALSPTGQLICVRPAQCAYINDWLSTNQPQLGDALGSPPGTFLKLYLTLCYRDCPVDQAPIAGEPCRSEAELMAPSRIADDFRLEFRLTPPQQGEEDALRQFVEWLNFFEIADGAGTFLTLEEFEALVRTSLEHIGIASPPHFKQKSPLSPPSHGIIHSSDACEFLRAAYRIWVTELRPLYHAICNAKPGCCGDVKAEGPAIDECLLLAEIDVSVISLGPGQGWAVQHLSDVAINERRRPFLIHLGLLQEMLLCGPRKCCGGGGSGTAGSQGPRGFQGLQGLPGHQGIQGVQGPQGATGPQGPAGPASPSTVVAAGSFLLPPDFIGLFNTGVNADGVVLASGAKDEHYVLAPIPNSPQQDNQSFVVNDAAFPFPPWLPNSSSSKWIGPKGDQKSGVAAGNYTYRFSFTVLGDPTGIVLTGNATSDDLGTITLNGSSSGVTGGAIGQSNSRFTPFSISGLLPNNVNTLEFKVNNQGTAPTASGLRVEISPPPIRKVQTVFTYKGLTASPYTGQPCVYILNFPGYKSDHKYVLKGTTITDSPFAVHSVEVIQITGFDPGRGITVRVMGLSDQRPISPVGFVVEISEYPPDPPSNTTATTTVTGVGVIQPN